MKTVRSPESNPKSGAAHPARSPKCGVGVWGSCIQVHSPRRLAQHAKAYELTTELGATCIWISVDPGARAGGKDDGSHDVCAWVVWVLSRVNHRPLPSFAHAIEDLPGHASRRNAPVTLRKHNRHSVLPSLVLVPLIYAEKQHGGARSASRTMRPLFISPASHESLWWLKGISSASRRPQAEPGQQSHRRR